MKRSNQIFAAASLLGILLTIAGCGGEPPATENGEGATTDTAAATTPVDDHSGWWCVEHGIPEEECSMCSADAAKAFREKGDWCEEHNRAESQCFQCDPARADKFAALYEAKYGKKPPAPKE